MPDVTFKFVGDDEVTPKINQIKESMEGLSKEGKGGMEGIKELTAGISYNIGLWNVGMMASQVAMDQIQKQWTGVQEDFTVAWQTWNRQSGNLDATNKQFTQLHDIAHDTHTSIIDTRKRFEELFSVGMGETEAYKAVRKIQDTLNATGIDLTQITAKAQLYQATPQEILGASQAGGQFAGLAAPARAEIDRQKMKELNDFQFELEQTEAERELQDETHNKEHSMELTTMVAGHEMEERQRVESEAMEDMHYRLDDELQRTDLLINREMEMRHHANQEAMEDRHRATQEAEDDAEHAVSNEEYGINRVKQARSLELRGRELFGQKETAWERKSRQYTELEEDRQLFKLEGDMHDLREKRRVTDRAMEHESIAEARKEYHQSFDERARQEDQAHDQRVSFHDAQVEMDRRHNRERVGFEYSHAADRMELSDDVYEKNRDLERKGQNYRIQQHGEELKGKYGLNEKFLQASGLPETNVGAQIIHETFPGGQVRNLKEENQGKFLNTKDDVLASKVDELISIFKQ